jgi:acyl-CoA synthetase (NDP forming)
MDTFATLETGVTTAPGSAIAPILAAAREAGREHLLEHEGLALARHLDIAVPFHRFIASSGASEGIDLSLFPGDRVVVKVVSPTILHKSDLGGVAVVPRVHSAVSRAIREMENRFAGWEVSGYLIEEHVQHDTTLGGELLLGLRWTDDFGPVVSLGLGGVYAELLARELRPGRDTAILSPALAEPERIARVLGSKAFSPLLFGGLRGQAPRLAREEMVLLLQRVLAFAAETMPHDLLEFEINPLVLIGGWPVALDALVRLGQGPVPQTPPRPIEKIRHLLEPRSVAVVGVSEKQMNPGRIILRNLLAQGFEPAHLHVVKPGVDEIEGCRCHPDLRALPERVDLAVLAIDASQVPAAVGEILAGRTAESLIVIPGGLGERSGSETAAERLRGALARERASDWRGPVVNGGNCLGIRSVPGHCDTLFIPGHKLGFPETDAAPLALLSQSGAFAISRTSSLASLNPRYLVSFGNQLDLTVGDYLTWMKDDPGVEVFACYVEGFRPLDGRRWLEAAAEISRSGRTVILYRAGRTPAGARATASHTAAIAGDFAVTRELAQEAGALVAETLEEFEDLTRLAVRLRGKRVDGWSLGALSNAGFECVAIADNLGRLRLAPFSAETEDRLTTLLAGRRLTGIVDVHNPLDVTPILDDAAYEDAVQAILDDPAVDVGIVGCVPLTPALSTLPPAPEHQEDLRRPDALAGRLARVFAASPKAWVAVVDAGPPYDPLARLLEERGIPVFRTVDRAMRVLERYCGWRVGSATRGVSRED